MNILVTSAIQPELLQAYLNVATFVKLMEDKDKRSFRVLKLDREILAVRFRDLTYKL